MNIGIIGAGKIGSTLAGRLTRLGHAVFLANSRGPETLTGVAQATGATPVTVHEAARRGDLIVVAIPLRSIPHLPPDLFAGVLADVPVVDTSNYYPLLRDGSRPELETGDLTESEWVQQHLGRPVVKAFNTILSTFLDQGRQPTGTPGRIALPVSGDEAATKQKVLALVEELGFDAVDNGSLHESWRQQPGTPAYLANLPAADLRQQLASLGLERTPAQRQQFLANHAVQEKQLQARGVVLK